VSPRWFLPTVASLAFAALLLLAIVGWLRLLHRPWLRERRVRLGLAGLASLFVLGQALALAAGGSPRAPAGAARPTLALVGARLSSLASALGLSLFFTLPLAGLARGALALNKRAHGRAPTPGPTAADRGADDEAASDRVVDSPTACAPTVDAPTVDAPTVGAPTVGAPTVWAPTVGAPIVGAPTVGDPILGAPTIAAPVVEPIARRAVLAALPVAGLAAAAAGTGLALREPTLTRRRLAPARLDPAHRGLRIAQLTDLHLGVFATVADVERLAERLDREELDLLVLTGDFADHLPLLEPALRLLRAVRTRHGTFAAMGNHEHFRGALETRRGYDRAGVDLVVNEHRALVVRDRPLVLVGVDDPGRRIRSNGYEAAAELALDGSPSDALRLGLCHRPSGFEVLAAAGVDVTLSGHTHGGQLGLGERSLFEGVAPGGQLWGTYERDGRLLYTSSGAGHWFAFRLGCPSEVPILELG
jgi:predicted MPP superfamily phosphohydrolase